MNKKRILSLLLAIVMVIGLVPTYVFATEGQHTDSTVTEPVVTDPVAPLALECETCGALDCTSTHENWCDICKKDDCGQTHTACDKCGAVDCQNTHENWCDVCKKDDCGQTHAACDKCGAVDCQNTHEKWCEICKKDDCGQTHTACDKCGTVDCQSIHENWCEICKKDDCGQTHTPGNAENPSEPSQPSEGETEPSEPAEPEGPKVGDKIWIKSGSKVYKNHNNVDKNFYTLMGSYEVEIKKILTNDEGAAEWYEFRFTDLGIGEIALSMSGYKYVHVENTTTVKPDEQPDVVEKEVSVNGSTIVASGNIPEDVTLTVEALEVTSSFAANEENEESKMVFAYDIKLLNPDNSEWQPENGETVSITLDAVSMGLEDGTKIRIVHDHDGIMKELGEYPVENGKLTFVTDGFSVFYGYTVDFEYDGEWYSIGGGGIIYLSQLFEELNINKSAYNIKDVEFSNPELISVSYENVGSYVAQYEWVLRSLEPFSTEELLTVIFRDGEELKIKVYDAAYTTLTNGMTLGNVTLNGAISVAGNVTITVNGTVTLNGNITIPNGATLTINGNGKIIRGSSNKGALFTVANGGTLNINAITIDGGASWTANQIAGSTRKTLSVTSGGQSEHTAIYSGGGATISLNGTTFQNLYSSKINAAIYMFGTVGNEDNIPPSQVTMTNVTFDRCATISDHSIVLLNYCYATLTGCSFTNNYVGNRYAGIIKAGGPANFCLLRMNNCAATNNYSSGWGGVILWAANTPYNGTRTEAFITNCTFTNNTARYLGGAISNEAIMTVSACTITGNTAMSGGGIASFPYTRTEDDQLADGNACGLVLGTGNVISGNHSVATGTFKPFSSEGNGGNQDAEGTLITNIIEYTGGGGGVWCFMNKSGWNCSLEIGEGNTIENNNATNIGGGVLVEHQAGKVTELKITGAEIKNNEAIHGGGVAVMKATVSIESGEITSNTASQNGGGIYADNGICLVTGTGSVSGNIAANGGGVYVDTNSKLTVNGGIITENYAVCAHSPTDHICAPGNHDATTAKGNSSGVGGGVYVASGALELQAAEGSEVGLYGNIADFAADDAYASSTGSTLKLPDVSGMPLTGTAYAAVDGWYIDYCEDDPNYPASLYENHANPGRYRSLDGERISAGESVEGGHYYCLTLGRTPTLVIEKRVPGSVKPDESFTFTVKKGSDVLKTVEFKPADFTKDSETNDWVATYTISKMLVGAITVTETLEDNTRFEFVSAVADVSSNETVTETTVSFLMTDDGEKVTYTNKYSITDITITKTVYHASTDVDSEENQTFLFHVKGTDENSKVVDMTVAINIAQVDENGTGAGSVTIKDVPVGSYTVTELENWSWRYDETDGGIVTKTITGNAESETNKFGFTNDREKIYWLSGDSYCENWWGGENGAVLRKD